MKSAPQTAAKAPQVSAKGSNPAVGQALLSPLWHALSLVVRSPGPGGDAGTLPAGGLSLPARAWATGAGQAGAAWPALQRKPALSTPGDASQHGGPSHGPPKPPDARGAPAKPWRPSGILRRAPSEREADSPERQHGRAVDAGAAVRAASFSGVPLATELRQFFEPRFGHDFSQVRVHTDAEAAAAARAVQGQAYTVGRDVVFGDGQYAPASAAGRHLLAHELAHVVQQGAAGRPIAQAMAAHAVQQRSGVHPAGGIGQPGDLFEQHADAVADQVMSGQSAEGLLDQVARGASEVQAANSVHSVQRASPAEVASAADNDTLGRATDRLLRGELLGTDYEAGPDGAFIAFKDPHLQQVLKHMLETWNVDPHVKDLQPPAPGTSGDSSGKDIAEHPKWVMEFQRKLMGQAPQGRELDYKPKRPPVGLGKPWDLQSETAQCLIEVYLHAWHSRNVRGAELRKPAPPAAAGGAADERPVGKAAEAGSPEAAALEGPGKTPDGLWRPDALPTGLGPRQAGVRITTTDGRYLRWNGSAWEAASHEVPVNVAELYSRIGASETNDQSALLGGKAGGPNWCGPASERSVALALMKRGWRFKGSGKLKLPKNPVLPAHPGAPPPKPADAKDWKATLAHNTEMVEYRKKESEYRLRLTDIVESFRGEVTAQGAFFIGKWQSKGIMGDTEKGRAEETWRGVGGKPAATVPLEPGDYIYVINGGGGPLSGHVATVVDERPVIDPATWSTAPAGTVLSHLYWVSGNARGVRAYEGAVRVEVVKREKPHDDFDYYLTAGIGNAADAYKSQMQNATATERKQLSALFDREYFKVAEQIGEQLWQAEADALTRANKPVGKKPGKVTLQVKARMHWENVLAFPQGAVARLAPFFGSYPGWGQALPLLQKMETAVQPILKEEAAFKASVASDTYKGAEIKDPKSKEVIGHKETHGHPFARDEGFGSVNKAGGATGRYAPLIADHSWVVSVVKASQFSRVGEELTRAGADAKAKATEADEAAATKAVTQAEDKVLEKYTLERMSGDIETNWPGAVSYWEGLGAFR